MKLFIDNKYTTWYFNIIENAKSRPIPECYTEKHHIIPKCMSGKEVVILTAREHFICHWLLTKMTTGKNKAKMWWGFNRMLMKGTSSQDRYYPNSKTYKLLREHSNTYNPMYCSDNKKKVSEALLGITRSAETRQKISNFQKGRVKSDKTRQKISNTMKGRKQTEAHKENSKKAWIKRKEKINNQNL